MVKWRHENPSKEIEKTPCNDPGILNLEHILPKNPSNAWGTVISSDKTIVQDCLNNIGNLCLLSMKANKKLGSSSFSEKSETVYQKSEIITTRDIALNFDNWTRASIEARASELAQLAIKAWPFE